MLRGLFLWMQMLKKSSGIQPMSHKKLIVAIMWILLQAFTKFGPHKKQKLYKVELM